jgi:hypothetical protein
MWRRFSFAQDRWSKVILVCMKLHNLCLDARVPVPAMRFGEDHLPGDEADVFTNERDDDAALRGNPTGDRRRVITEELERRGVVRPPHAAVNSRA